MEFAQPTNSIVTDKTKAEEKRVTEIRNQVSLLEGESMRLRDLIQAEKYEINELVKQKAELEPQLPALTAKRIELEEKVAQLLSEVDALEIQKQTVVVETNTAIEKASVITQNADKAHEYMLKELALLEEAKADLIKSEESFYEKTMVFAEKQAKLRELIS